METDMTFRHSTAVGALFVVLLGGCDEEGPNIDVESAIPVRTEPVQRQPIAEYITATSSAQANNSATLTALQSGAYRLQDHPTSEKPYAMGDVVDAGGLVAILENPEFENQVSIESKRLQYTSAQREFEKQKALFDKGGITLREVTDAERMFIDADYALENARLQLARLEVRAPFAGILVDLPHRSVGELVEAGAQLGQLMDYETLYAEVSLPGEEIDRVMPGQSLRAMPYGRAEADTLTGEVEQVSPVLDAESRMFKVTLRVANAQLALRPGMFLKVELIADARDSAIVIARDVISDRAGNHVVYVVDKGVALERVLELGIGNREAVEVLSGLEVDEDLVVEGFETLRDRSRVKTGQ
jgi:RND family efflux transporter MFP subunit